MSLFERIEYDQIPAAWPLIEQGLRSIKLRCPSLPWEPCDVRRRLRDGSAVAHVRADGFIVLERCEEYFSREPFMNVWLMWFQPGAGEAIINEAFDWVDAACISSRCEWWEFGSPRGLGDGIERVARRRFDHAITIWRRRP